MCQPRKDRRPSKRLLTQECWVRKCASRVSGGSHEEHLWHTITSSRGRHCYSRRECYNSPPRPIPISTTSEATTETPEPCLDGPFRTRPRWQLVQHDTDRGNIQRGTAFQLTPAGKIIPWSFDGKAPTVFPYSGLTLGTDGNFYGTTSTGALRGGNRIQGHDQRENHDAVQL